MTNLLRFYSILVTFLVLILSCKQEHEEPPFTQSDILGRWELAFAQVDGKETDRLRSLYFIFLADTSLLTNIFGSETNYEFSIQEDLITQMSEPPITYHLLEHTDTSLHMQTQLRGKQFTMELHKAKPKRRAPEKESPGD